MVGTVALAKLHGVATVDQALRTAALAGRFSDNDVIRISAHQRETTPNPLASEIPADTAWGKSRRSGAALPIVAMAGSAARWITR